MEQIIKIILEKPEILVTILSGFLLPITLVWLNNYYNIRSKTKEKALEADFNSKEEIRSHEKAIYASLSKILFDVQQLHVALSGTCVDKNCITDALKKFDESLTVYHDEISNNLLYMSSNVINEIYRFYSKISDLKISLKEFNDSGNYEMAHVSVYVSTTDLAEIVMNVQELLISKKKELQIEFNKAQQEMMRYCCGSKPPKELFDKYLDLLKQIKPYTSGAEISRLEIRWGEANYSNTGKPSPPKRRLSK